MSEVRKLTIGDHVIYTDKNGQERNALVTVVFDGPGTWGPGDVQGCNLVTVHKDESREDQYGRQIDREATSVVHESYQPAHGNYWKWPEK